MFLYFNIDVIIYFRLITGLGNGFVLEEPLPKEMFVLSECTLDK